MIEHSFIFLEGIGRKTEERLWKMGIKTWNDFLKSTIHSISKKRKFYYNRRLEEAKVALIKDPSYFASVLPQSEMWRLYPIFKDSCCFLDIEVDSKGAIILITLFNRFESKTLVKGMHLDQKNLSHELEKYDLIITYNGSAFDLPKIKKQFNLALKKPHIDLKPLCQRLGLKGGLKDIEQAFNILRPQHLRGSPVQAWKAFWASGDKEYLDLLVQYNEEDAVNLYQLLEKCLLKLKQKYELWPESIQ